MNKKIIYILSAIILIIGFFGLRFYNSIFGLAVSQNTTIFIKTETSFNDLTVLLSSKIKDTVAFKKVSKLKKFSKPKAGMYKLTKGMTTNTLINTLRSGNQTPVKVSFNNQDTLEKLAGRISEQLETDSLSLIKAMKDPKFLKNNNFTKKSALAMYIPNQYEFYWTDTADKFRDKMLQNYNTFWNNSRLQKAKKLGLTKKQVITLASIVQKETAQTTERPTVAGLYLNRLKTKGWKLQADPTLIFALKEKYGHHKVYKRVLNKDKKIESPYNTYKYPGLPPTLIAMPDISSIDAVLNPEQHNYFFMCASTENIGFHKFAKTLEQHNRNAIKYQRWITQKGISR